LFLAGIVGDFVLEATLLHFDTYVYYGWQPLVVLKFPLWWGPVNSLITMIAGAVILRFERVLTTGWRQLLIIPVALTISAAGNTIAGWPSWLVINTNVGFLWTQVGGVATFALSAWFMWMVIEVVGQTSAVAERADVCHGADSRVHTSVRRRARHCRRTECGIRCDYFRIGYESLGAPVPLG
jgi:hypothetical protein